MDTMDTEAILTLRKQGKSYRDIAQQLGISKSTVANVINKSFLNPRWLTVQGADPRPVDAFGAIPAPTAEQLLMLNEDTVFSCVDWCAKQVGKAKLRVLVKTLPHQRKPKCATIPITKAIRQEQAVEVAEVLEHPLVELLSHPNRHLSKYDALYYLDSQLSLTGNGFVFVERENFQPHHKAEDGGQVNEGLPVALWPIMTQFVTIQAEHGHIIGYSYSLQAMPIFYRKHDILHFRMISHLNPYAEGYGPVRAAYERILLGKYELAYLNSLFRNQARPDALVLLKGGATSDQCERVQKELSMRFSKGGIGGPMVIDGEDMELQNLQWQPKDLLGQQLYEWTKLQICNAFSLNEAIFSTDSANRSNGIEARRQSQEQAIEPRLRLIEELLNHRLCPEFDSRLFVEYENPVEDDKEFDLQKRTQYLSAGVYSIDEVRAMEGLPVEPKDTKLEEASGGTNDLRASVGGSQALMQLQTAVYGGQLPREAGIANARIVFGFSQEEAEALFPEQPAAPPAQPGASPMPPVPSPEGGA